MRAVRAALLIALCACRLHFDDLPAADAEPPCMPGVAVRAIDAGHDFMCAQLTDDTLQCWGGNDTGQLGDGTSDRERKRMLALLIEDVTLIKQQQITAAVRFRGGATTTLTLPRPLTAQQLRATHADVRTQIDQLLGEYSDAQVAHILNERGLRTGAGDAFDAAAVQWVRCSAKLPSLKQRLIASGMLTTRQLGERLGVKRTTIQRWRTQGLVEGRICNALGEWLYWPPAQIPSTTTPPNMPMGNSTARGAM